MYCSHRDLLAIKHAGSVPTVSAAFDLFKNVKATENAAQSKKRISAQRAVVMVPQIETVVTA